MPFTHEDCYHCGSAVHSDDVLDQVHATGCGKDLDPDWCASVWHGTPLPDVDPDE